jgi:hypothetical protein
MAIDNRGASFSMFRSLPSDFDGPRARLHRWERLSTGGHRCADCGSTSGTRLDSYVFPCPGPRVTLTEK